MLMHMLEKAFWLICGTAKRLWKPDISGFWNDAARQTMKCERKHALGETSSRKMARWTLLQLWEFTAWPRIDCFYSFELSICLSIFLFLGGAKGLVHNGMGYPRPLRILRILGYTPIHPLVYICLIRFFKRSFKSYWTWWMNHRTRKCFTNGCFLGPIGHLEYTSS